MTQLSQQGRLGRPCPATSVQARRSPGSAGATRFVSQQQRWSARRRGSRHSLCRASADLKAEAEPRMYSSFEEPITSFGFQRDFGEEFELGERLGAGAFAIVHAATNKKTGERFAVKTMPKKFGPAGHLEHHFARRVLNEVDICNHLGRSLNVCYLWGTYEDDSCVDLVMELCEGGQLWDRIRKGRYTEGQAMRLIQEVLRTVAQCHAKSVLIRDVKPENFLFLNPEDDSPLKAVDFGISIYCKPDQYVEHRAGTPIYLAPEVVRQKYGLPADVWSAGILAYLLLTGRLPFAGEEGLEVSEMYMTKQVYNNKEVFRAILYAPLDFESSPWDSISEEGRDLVQSLLQRDEKLRPTAEQALQHRWFQRCDHSSFEDVPLSDSIVQRLQRFGTYGRLKQVALTSVAHGIAADSELVSDLREMFRQLDPADSGKVKYDALAQALQDGHFDLSASEVQQLMAQIDVSGSGDICFDEWIASLLDWRKVQDTPEWDALVSKAFDRLDTDHSGRIDLNELELLLCGEQGCPMEDEVGAALREADIDHDGGIDLPEFRRLVASQPQDRLDLFESRLAAKWRRPQAGTGQEAGEGRPEAAAEQ